MKNKKRKAAGGLTFEQIEKHKRRLRKRCCSESWVDAVIYHAAQYPPKSLATPMRKCPACEITYPFMYFDGSVCTDCHYALMPRSLSSKLPGCNAVRCL